MDASAHQSLVCDHTGGATDVVGSQRTTMMMMMMMMMMMETQVGGGLVVAVFNLTFTKLLSVHMRQTRHALADFFRLSSVA